MKHSLCASTALVSALAGLELGTALLYPSEVSAACTTNGGAVTCDTSSTWTSTIGNGASSPIKTVVVNPNAKVAIGNANAISLGDNVNISIGAGGSVTNTATTAAGLQSAGPNTIEFGSFGTLTVAA